MTQSFLLIYVIGVFGALTGGGSCAYRFKAKLKKISFVLSAFTPILNYYIMWETFQFYHSECACKLKIMKSVSSYVKESYK